MHWPGCGGPLTESMSALAWVWWATYRVNECTGLGRGAATLVVVEVNADLIADPGLETRAGRHEVVGGS